MNGEVINTLKVQATHGSGLRNSISKALTSRDRLADGGQTKVVKMGGHLITTGLAKAEQFGGPGSCQMSRTNKCNVDVEMDCRT